MSNVRESSYWRYDCTAPEEALIENYDDIPDEIKAEIENHHGLPCDGGFRPGSWCLRCFWGEVEEDIEI